MSKELCYEDIVYMFDMESLNLRENEDVIPEYNEVYKKIKSALEIEKSGYNLFLIDDFSKEKLFNIISFAKKIYKDRTAPKDICYVIKEDVKNPKVMFISNGKGVLLKKTLDEIKNYYSECIFEFYNSTSLKEKEAIIDNIQKKRNELIGKLAKAAEDDGFEIRTTQTGFTFIPLKEGGVMTEKEYDILSLDEKDDILNKVSRLKISAQDILEELKNIELDEISKIKEFMQQYFDEQTKEMKESYYTSFCGCKEATEYLDFVCGEIEINTLSNYSISYEDDEEKINEIIYRYEINVIVDNSDNSCPAVIYEEDPSVINLLGSIEYENRNGVYTTDISLVRSGSLLKANEGCLIIRANTLLTNQAAYYYLKKSLLNEKIDFDYNRGYLELLSLSGLKPEPVKLKQKIILIGDYETFDLLYTYDEDFKKIFKLRAEYNPIIPISDQSKKILIRNINRVVQENNLKQPNQDALKELAKFLSRKAENRDKLFFDDNEINRVLIVSNNIVENEGGDYIEGRHIIQSAYQEEEIEKSILENYKEKKLMLNVEGEIIGQINGLSVLDSGYFSFGKPMKITCCCYKGDGNIIDVHKESNLSGNIHSKSINILKGYLSRLTGEYTKLPVDFHLSFEQIYGRIDGDSASVAETICMISALSKKPVKQNIAVTGSINQFGQVQPIGGVNEKIEGFFKACKLIHSSKNKGVLIPLSNAKDLVLSSEVEKSISEGEFHIYTMSTVADAIEVLMCTNETQFEDVYAAIEDETQKYSKKSKEE